MTPAEPPLADIRTEQAQLRYENVKSVQILFYLLPEKCIFAHQKSAKWSFLI